MKTLLISLVVSIALFVGFSSRAIAGNDMSSDVMQCVQCIQQCSGNPGYYQCSTACYRALDNSCMANGYQRYAAVIGVCSCGSR